jgi:hypothetical protein
MIKNMQYTVIIIGVVLFLILQGMSFCVPDRALYWNLVANMELLLSVCFCVYSLSKVDTGL